ncbi:hypothetical protein FBUS_00490 [Fasciolopsis buskii]|uniref:Uncharacterized protein n=1 Tax=Fasciolopsis buskii TaxID=27845 RepID=A0A8E0S8B7_9TREM|nr:hypothetical protein FBUS_00490 [Fasciolopsis buski]
MQKVNKLLNLATLEAQRNCNPLSDLTGKPKRNTLGVRESALKNEDTRKVFTGMKVIPVRSDKTTPRLQEVFQQYTPCVPRNTPLRSRPGYSHAYTFEESSVAYRNSGGTPEPRRSSVQFFSNGPVMKERLF